jgi:hypothetical protein
MNADLGLTVIYYTTCVLIIGNVETLYARVLSLCLFHTLSMETCSFHVGCLYSGNL